MKTSSSFLVDDILRRGEDDIRIGEGGGGLGRRPVVRQSGRTQRHKLKKQSENIIEEEFRTGPFRMQLHIGAELFGNVIVRYSGLTFKYHIGA
jgi:hypothetical protein